MLLKASIRSLLFLTVLVPVSSCGVSAPAPEESDLTSELQVEVFPPEYAILGEPVEYTFDISNRSSHPIVLLELLPVSQDVTASTTIQRTLEPVQQGSIHRWTMFPGGTFQRHPRRNRLTFSPGKSAPPLQNLRLYTGLLRPGSQTRVRLRVLHQTSGRTNQHFTLRYHRPSRQELQNRLYLPEKPLSRTDPESVEFKSARLQRVSGPKRHDQMVINPPFQIVVEHTFSRPIWVFEGSFPSSKAEKIVQNSKEITGSAEQFRYDPIQKRWLVRTQDDTAWSISADERVKSIPSGLFDDITHLSTHPGPVTFYYGPRLTSDRNQRQHVQSIIGDSGGMSSRTDRRRALDVLESLRNSDYGIQWTRAPLTNHPAAIVLKNQN